MLRIPVHRSTTPRFTACCTACHILRHATFARAGILLRQYCSISRITSYRISHHTPHYITHHASCHIQPQHITSYHVSNHITRHTSHHTTLDHMRSARGRPALSRHDIAYTPFITPYHIISCKPHASRNITSQPITSSRT